jgi:hypothetical protein
MGKLAAVSKIAKALSRPKNQALAGTAIAIVVDVASKLSIHRRRVCPFCAEKIKRKAIICRYCQRDVVLE